MDEEPVSITACFLPKTNWICRRSSRSERICRDAGAVRTSARRSGSGALDDHGSIRGSASAVPQAGRLSAAGIGFLDRPASAGELGLLQGRLTGPQARTPMGLSRTVESDRGGRSLNPGRRWSPLLAPGHRPPAVSQRPALPSNAFHLRGIDVKASWPCCQGILPRSSKGV